MVFLTLLSGLVLQTLAWADSQAPIRSTWDAATQSYVTESGTHWLPVRAGKSTTFRKEGVTQAVFLDFGQDGATGKDLSAEIFQNDRAAIREFSGESYGVYSAETPTAGTLRIRGREYRIDHGPSFADARAELIGPASGPAPIHVETADLRAYFAAKRPSSSNAWIGFFTGHSIELFTSRDSYETRGIQLQIEDQRNRWRIAHNDIHPVYEIFYLHESQGMDSVGAMVWARTEREIGRGMQFYFQVGVGGEHNNKLSHDLDTFFNFTPSGEVGIVLDAKSEHPTRIGLRLAHFSNAGTNRPNWGQNMLLLVISRKL